MVMGRRLVQAGTLCRTVALERWIIERCSITVVYSYLNSPNSRLDKTHYKFTGHGAFDFWLEEVMYILMAFMLLMLSAFIGRMRFSWDVIKTLLLITSGHALSPIFGRTEGANKRRYRCINMRAAKTIHHRRKPCVLSFCINEFAPSRDQIQDACRSFFHMHFHISADRGIVNTFCALPKRTLSSCRVFSVIHAILSVPKRHIRITRYMYMIF